MSTIDEVLATAEVVDAVCVIDGETRIISVPAEYKELGVESDEKVTRIKFQCPKIVGDNVDLTEYNLYINYRNAGNKLNSYLVEDATVIGDVINFSWLLSRHVTESPGTINYIVCAKKSDGTGVINEWNTKVATGTVGVGLEATEEIEEQNIDIIEQILRSIVELENNIGGGGSGGYYAPSVDAAGNLSWTASKTDMPAVPSANIKGPAGADGKSAYAYAVEGGYTGTETAFAAKLAAQIPTVDSTLTQSDQAADAKAVGDRFNSLSEEIANLPTSGSGSGLSSNAKTLLIAILRNAIYNSDQSVNITELEVELERTSGGGAVTYTVESNLTNVTSDNTKVLVDANASYTATLTADDGCVLDVVTVIMGGEDVTASVYADGVITIPAVTGDVIITATAIAPNADILATTTWTDGVRVNNAGDWTGQTNRCASDYIAVEAGDIITIMLKDGVTGNKSVEYGNFNADKKHLKSGGSELLSNSSDTYSSSMMFTVGDSTAYIRISYGGTSSNIIITATRQRGSV